MEKRYQVFISSTFADLEDERRKVMEAVLECNCFPAGMEMFPSLDMKQFSYIKTIIDKSDYYILVIAGRYGSLAEDGISYTEKEYDYAVKMNIPILAFIKRDIDTIPANKTDGDPIIKNKLLAFRKRVEKNRLLSYWDEPYELKAKILSSLHIAIREQPRLGWIRDTNSSVTDKNNSLKSTIDIKPSPTFSTNTLNKKIEISYFESTKSYTSFTLSIGQIIKGTGQSLIEGVSKEQFGNLLLKVQGYKKGTISNKSIENVIKTLIEEKIVANKFNYEPVIFTANSRKAYLNLSMNRN